MHQYSLLEKDASSYLAAVGQPPECLPAIHDGEERCVVHVQTHFAVDALDLLLVV
jgi:hypothetical protein